MDSLESIERIDGLGIFDEYERKEGLPDFGRFNVFYGSNGSGKTTFTRLFACLNSGTSEEHPGLKYSIKLDSGGSIKEGQPLSPSKIRVFNSDYITNNIGRIDGQLNPIFIIGEENQELVQQIQKDEEELGKLNEKLAAENEKKGQQEKSRGKKFTDIAKTISTETSGHTMRNYRRPNAESSYYVHNPEEPVRLSAEEISNYQRTIRQQEKEPELSQIETAKIVKINELVQQIQEDVPSVCAKMSGSFAIERLRINPDIAAWVEAGRALHEKHPSGTCEYCQQVISKNRLNELSDHFNRSDTLLKEEIEAVGKQIKTVIDLIENLTFPPKSELYDEMRGTYEIGVDDFQDLKNALIHDLRASEKILEDKLNRRTERLLHAPHFDIVTLGVAVKILNGMLREHNQKSQTFDEHSKEAKDQIEAHYLTGIQPDIEDYDRKIAALTQVLNSTQNSAASLEQQIKVNKARVSNTTQAAADITERLGVFLGREDLKLEVEDEGYRLLRNGRPAKRLSEGEKTAIAFMYFVVQLKDAEFDLKNGIIVIDDPVSSLDSNSLYQAFAFLKDAVKGAGQIFLLTHNYEFLKLLLTWVKRIPKGEGKKKYYMIFNAIENEGKRVPRIGKLDETLQENQNEYVFLLKILYGYTSNNTILGSYHMPNTARKVLETFLEFYRPGNESNHTKLDAIDFDKHKKTAIRKFLDDNSHATGSGLNPALVPGTEKNVEHLLEMIGTFTPIQLEALKDSDASQA